MKLLETRKQRARFVFFLAIISVFSAVTGILLWLIPWEAFAALYGVVFSLCLLTIFAMFLVDWIERGKP